MSYTPTAADFQDSSAKKRYIPTAEDFALPAKEKNTGINNKFTPLTAEEKSGVGEAPYYAPSAGSPEAPNWEELKSLAKNSKEFGQGASQSVINYPGEIANLVKPGLVPKADYAPNTQAANIGKGAGEVGSFFMPGGALKLLKPVNALSKAAKNIPFASSALGVAKNALNAGVLSATQNPKEPLKALGRGAQEGALSQLAMNVLTSKIPLAKPLIHAASGAIGYQAGNSVGHPLIGAEIGAFAPSALKALGLSNKNSVAQQALNDLKAEDVKNSVMANRRLGTAITPAQASGNYPKAAEEAMAKRSVAGAQEGYKLEREQEEQQRAAINKTLDKIYKPTSANEKAINDAYDRAHTVNVNPKLILKMRENPVLEKAFDSVKNLPAFKNIPENNYKYLAQVDRTLGRMQKGAQINDPNSAYTISEIKQGYSKFLKDVNPHYAEATRLAQPKIVRRNIEEKLNKNEEDYTGKNFYSKFLNSRANTANLLRDVKNFPAARKDIQDMRTGWKHLSNIKTVSQSAAQSQSGIDQARDQFKAMIQNMKNIVGAKDDVKALQYIHSKDSKWFDDFDRLSKIQNIPERNRKWLTLLGGIAEGAGLTHQDDEE